MEWKSIEDSGNPGNWRVEAIDFDNEGEVSVVLFSGPKAQNLADEYAQWKNSVEQRKPIKKAM